MKAFLNKLKRRIIGSLYNRVKQNYDKEFILTGEYEYEKQKVLVIVDDVKWNSEEQKHFKGLVETNKLSFRELKLCSLLFAHGFYKEVFYVYK